MCLENWLKYFRLQQIHIVDGDNLRKQPLQELKRSKSFWILNHIFTKSISTLTKHVDFTVCVILGLVDPTAWLREKGENIHKLTNQFCS